VSAYSTIFLKLNNGVTEMKIADFPVVDSSKKLTITITPKDVAKGNTKDPAACAAAQACMRQTGATEARVHLGRTYLKMEKKWVRFNTPEALRSEIISFDRGHEFQPGDYTLRPMPPSFRAKAGKRQGSATAGARDRGSKSRVPKKPRTKPHVVHGVRAHGANR
jgi:hypothetical protein